MAGTTWPSLSAGQPARAADVESKFDWIEGAIVPMTAGNMTDATYDLGTTTARWLNLYLGGNISMANGTFVRGSDIGGTQRNMIGVNGSNILVIGATAGLTDVAILPGTLETARFTKGGSLGIGTPTPSAHLVVSSSATTTSYIETTLASGTSFFRIGSPTLNWDIALRGQLGSALTIESGGNVRMGFNTNGSIAIGTSTADGSALLDLQGTKALTIPRLSTAERDALTPKDGMMIYNSTTALFNIRQNGVWTSMGNIIGLLTHTSSTINSVTPTTTAYTTTVNFSGSGRVRTVMARRNTAGFQSTTSVDVRITMDGITQGVFSFAPNTGSATPVDGLLNDTGSAFFISTLSTTNPNISWFNFKTTCLIEQRLVAPVGVATNTSVLFVSMETV